MKVRKRALAVAVGKALARDEGAARLAGAEREEGILALKREPSLEEGRKAVAI